MYSFKSNKTTSLYLSQIWDWQSPLKGDVFVTIGISETVNPNENVQRKTFPNVVGYNSNGIKVRFKNLVNNGSILQYGDQILYF